MKIQLHWQFKDGHTQAVAQIEIDAPESHVELIRAMSAEHPLPKDAVYLVCTEDSHFFDKEFSNSTGAASSDA